MYCVLQQFIIVTSPPVGKRSTVMSLLVCPPASVSHEPHAHTSPNFLLMFPVVVVSFFSVGVAICCVFPVLWVTSYLPIICHNASRASTESYLPGAALDRHGVWCLRLSYFTLGDDCCVAGDPVEVLITMFVSSVSSISEVNMVSYMFSFSVDLKLNE